MTRHQVDTDPEYRCLACGETASPLETVDIAGIGPVKRCYDPVACRRRAERAGVWCAT